MNKKILSKSNYVNGLKCLNYLWTIFHRPQDIPETDEATQYRFDQGHLVGELAKTHYPEGIDIPYENNLTKTQEYLKLGKPLFEAAFLAGRIMCRPDILKPVEDGKWDIIEVKSSTRVKDENYYDVAFQRHCCEKAGLKIRNCFLMHINNEYVRKGKIDAEKLFVKTDITDEVKNLFDETEKNIKLMLGVIDSPKRPCFKIGSNCSSPYECPLADKCWSFLPEYNIFELYGKGKTVTELFEKKIYAIKDIPAGFKLNDKQEIQKKEPFCSDLI